MKTNKLLFLSAPLLAAAFATVTAQAQTLLPSGTYEFAITPGLSSCTETSLLYGTCIIRIQTGSAPYGYFATDRYWPQLDLANNVAMNPVDDAFYCPAPVAWTSAAHPLAGGAEQALAKEYKMTCVGKNLHNVTATITVVLRAYNHTYSQSCGGRVRTTCKYTYLWFDVNGTITTVTPAT